ncbi:MAG TPA: AMP-binding protein, partial [Polyangiaceae bacterium]|nr:AMP-binding protein [Polyangiaceae bacterium]
MSETTVELSALKRAARAPDACALITPELTLTYIALAECIEHCANALFQAGHLPSASEEPLQPLAVVARPTLASLVLLHTLIAYQVPFALLHPRLPTQEREQQARELGARVILEPDEHPLAAGIRRAPPPPEKERPGRVLAIVATSGSSGSPKWIALTRAAFQSSALASAANLPLSDSDRWLLCLPLSHIGGLSIVTRCLLAGCAVVTFDPTPGGLLSRLPQLTSWIERSRCSVVSWVPAVLDAWLERRDLSLPKSVRAVLLGGAACSERLLGRAVERGVPVLTTYGLTEACSQVTTTSYGTVPIVEQGQVSSGQALPGVELWIDSEQHICVRGPML